MEPTLAARALAAATEITASALSDTEPDDVLGTVVRHAAELADADLGLVMVRTDDGEIRERVRALKQLLETGEVLRVDGQPEGHRTPLGQVGIPVMRQLMRRGTR